jgi:PGF-pre-PGF domain-containing protein
MVMLKKGVVLFLIFVCILVPSIFALTLVDVNSPSSEQNLSGVITLNTTVDGTGINNVTFRWLNTSGDYVLNVTVLNSSADQTTFTNITFNTTALLDGIYNLTVNATNATVMVGNSSVTGIRVDNTAPVVTLANSSANLTQNITTIGFNSTDTWFNITSCVLYFNDTAYNSSSTVGNLTNSIFFTNATLPDGNYSVEVNCTDNSGNQGASSSINVMIDITNPTITSFSCNDIDRGQNQDCACSPSDNSESFGGYVTEVINTADTSTTGIKTVSCDATDFVGNIFSDSTTYTVKPSGGGGSGSGSSSSSSVEEKENKYVNFINGQENRVEFSNQDLGITALTLTLRKNFNNALVSVKRLSQKPSETGEIEGEIYGYLSVDVEDLEDSDISGNVKITFEVEDLWLSNEGISSDEVVLKRYTSDWDDLPTIKIGSRGTKGIYEAEAPGFSNFAMGIVEETVEPQAGANEPNLAPDTNGESSEESVASSGYFLVGIIIVAALVFAFYYFKSKK